MYDALLGGRDNYAADRAMAEALLEACPGVRTLARENRAFVLKAAGWCVPMLGIRQFLDLGCGLPSSPDVHEVVRAAGVDGTAVVYVDHDACVASHVRASIEGEGPGLAVIEADVTGPEAVLGDRGLLEVIDPDRPVCVILGAVLSGMDAAVARSTVAGYAEMLVPGSAIVISCASFKDEATGQRMSDLFAEAGAWRNHTRLDIETFFGAGGLRVVRDRVGDVSRWPLLASCAHADAAVLGGVGVVDRP